jgi:amidase
VHGPLARTVADAAALLDAMAVTSPGEPFVPASPPDGGYLAALSTPSPRRRIALAVDPPLDGPGLDITVDPACRAAAEDVGALLAELGHEVEPVAIRLPDEGVDAFLTLWQVLSLGDPVDPADEPRLQPLTRYLRSRGREVAGMAAMAALHTVQIVTRALVAERAGYDAVLTPTVALPPRPVGWFTETGDPADDFARQIAFTPWTAIANLTGEPAISLPLAWSDGLPIGVALRGRRGEEAVLLGLAAELESARPWADRRPPEV